jgi:predicted Ser/Thr protein kinase
MTFLSRLMQLVKEGVVEVQRSVDYGEVEWMEIIGKGVSGIVWKGTWQKKVCAIKRFNEVKEKKKQEKKEKRK